MRWGVLAMSLTSSIAVAQPQVPAKPHLEYAARLGVSWMQTEGGLEDVTPSGRGPCFDGELAWRFSDFSISLFGAFYTFHATSDANDQTINTWVDARYNVADLGVRANLHSHRGGQLFGVGLAEELVRQSGRASSCFCENSRCDPCTPVYDNRRVVHWNATPLVELHLGVILPKGPVSIELVAFVGIGTNPVLDKFAPMTLMTERLAVGVRF